MILIQVLGPFNILNAQGDSCRPKGRKECALLAILALSPSHRQTRKWLQSKLWSDRGEEQGAASLRQALLQIRKVLGDRANAVQADRTHIWLTPEMFEFDHLNPEKTSAAEEEILQGMDLKDNEFNNWLRDIRQTYKQKKPERIASDSVKVPAPVQKFAFQRQQREFADPHADELADLVIDAMMETALMIGNNALLDQRSDTGRTDATGTPDVTINTRLSRLGNEGIISVCALDRYGYLIWQIRRTIDLRAWFGFRMVQNEIAQQFQDFIIEMGNRRSAIDATLWTAEENACTAMLGVIQPGLVSIPSMEACAHRAVQMSPRAPYLALVGMCQVFRHGERIRGRQVEPDFVIETFARALHAGPANGLVHAFAGHAHSFLLNDVESGLAHTRNAVKLAPGSAICWGFYATSLAYSGQVEKALVACRKFRQLSRFSIIEPLVDSIECYISFISGDLHSAIKTGENSAKTIPDFRPTNLDLMACYALTGQKARARTVWGQLRQREPDLCADMIRSPEYPIVSSNHRELVVSAVQKMGLN